MTELQIKRIWPRDFFFFSKSWTHHGAWNVYKW